MRIRILLAAACLLIGSTSAYATCTKPLSATYVGSGSGAAIDRNTGAAVQFAAISLSVTVSSTGSMKIKEIGKSFTAGDYTASHTVASSKNTFNTTTCQGQVTLEDGTVYVYTSANSGSVVTFIYYTADNIVAVYNLRLEKV